MTRIAVVTLIAFVSGVGTYAVPAQDATATGSSRGGVAVALRTRDGKDTQGLLSVTALRFASHGGERDVPITDVLSLHTGTAASAREAEIIARDLPLLLDADRQRAAVATDELLAIGLPVLTPLLESFADTDAHEPDSRYRLFERLLPAGADRNDRTLDMLRLADGSVLRGRLRTAGFACAVADIWHGEATGGAVVDIPAGELRSLFVARAQVTRTFDLHALHDCTYVDWVTTGIVPSPVSTIRADAHGFVRLSFAEDGWATGPDGLFETLPGKRKLQEGFRWGCVLYRLGPSGQRLYAGSHLEAKAPAADAGMLQFVVNDNEHWQNNIGAYRVTVTVDRAFDVGDAH